MAVSFCAGVRMIWRDSTTDIVPVGDDPANQREQQDGELPQEIVKAEVERGFRQVEDQPRLSDLLHPISDSGGEGYKPQNAKVAVGEGGKGAAQQA